MGSVLMAVRLSAIDLLLHSIVLNCGWFPTYFNLELLYHPFFKCLDFKIAVINNLKVKNQHQQELVQDCVTLFKLHFSNYFA